MRLDPARFDEWFKVLHPEQSPFPWQRRLFREWLCPLPPAQPRWPGLIRLPTAAGKTALIDLAVLALAVGSPAARRRIAFVVDRRVVVDEAALRARSIAKRLREALDSPDDPLWEVARSLVSLGGDEPLVVAVLRGGIPSDDGWARSPAQPAVVLSTVDQLGSRLLFRAYGGHGPRSWPIHAGLLGRDTVIIVDEAHCAVAFCDTALAIVKRWQRFAESPVGDALALVRMSATPGEKPDFELDESDRNHQALQARLQASKPADLVLVEASPDQCRRKLVEAMLERSHRLLNSIRRGVLAIVLNRVADARAVFEQLSIPDDRKLLLTGRVRGWERDRMLQKWLPHIRAGSRQEAEGPLVVVATQCIEVGANLDFDFLITEIAPLDALQQRFGRLDRLGERGRRLPRFPHETDVPGMIVAASCQVEPLNREGPGEAKFPDPIYEHALCRTWAWLIKRSEGDPPRLDFGIQALAPILPESAEAAGLCRQANAAFPLLPAHLDLLCQTSPPPEPSPEISAFLHGTTGISPDVTVVWRADLPPDKPREWLDRVAVQPPAPGEGCAVPIWEFQRWLAGAPGGPAEDGGDLEGVRTEAQPAPGDKLVLKWRGASQAELTTAKDIVAGDLVVVPASYGGCDKFGWNPASTVAVEDIADAAAHAAGRRPVLRLRALAAGLASSEGVEEVRAACEDLERLARGEEDAPGAAESLARLAASAAVPDWLRKLAKSLAEDRRVRVVDAGGAGVVLGRRGSGEDLSTADDGSAVGAPVALADHSAGVRDQVARLAKHLNLPEPLLADLTLAAWLHDVGKADPRFQVFLNGGDELAAALACAPLAKSGQNARNRAAHSRALVRARYPKAARHEVQSLALIANVGELAERAHDWDLVQHLVVSHHGSGRPLVPVVPDAEPLRVELEHGSLRLSHTSDHRLYRLDSGIAERYWRLVRRYGWWGLAWLEAILRLADWLRSADEERLGVDSD